MICTHLVILDKSDAESVQLKYYYFTDALSPPVIIGQHLQALKVKMCTVAVKLYLEFERKSDGCRFEAVLVHHGFFSCLQLFKYTVQT